MSELRKCSSCRYWSAIAMEPSAHGLRLRAACLSLDSPHAMQFMPFDAACRDWAHDSLGAIDEPGRDPERYITTEAKQP